MNQSKQNFEINIDDEDNSDTQKSQDSSSSKMEEKNKNVIWFWHYSIFPNKNQAVAFLTFFNFRYLMTLSFAVGLTVLCKIYDFGFQSQALFFASPIAIAIAFIININFLRRERSLDSVALLREHASSVIMNFRTMNEMYDYPSNILIEMSNRVFRLCYFLSAYLMTENLEKRKIIDKAILEDTSDVVHFSEQFNNPQLITTRIDLYKIYENIELFIVAIQNLKTITDNPPPKSMMTFSKTMLFLVPILLSPYYVETNRMPNGEVPWYSPITYAIVFATLSSFLHNFHSRIENLFQGKNSQVNVIKELVDYCIILKEEILLGNKPSSITN